MPTMVKVSKVNMPSFLELIKMPPGESSETNKNSANGRCMITKDIGRGTYVEAHGKIFNDHKQMWETIDENVAKTYMQGFIGGDILTLVNQLYFGQMYDMKNQNPEATTPELPKRISLKENDPDFCLKPDVFIKLTFAFYDIDKSNTSTLIPCALGIYCLKNNPDFWYIGLIKNTTASLEQQEVHLIAPKELTYSDDTDLKEANSAVDALIQEIHTDKIKNLLHGIFLPDGKVNIKKLASLEELIHPMMTKNENEAIELIAQISGLEKQNQSADTKRQILNLTLALHEKETSILEEQEQATRKNIAEIKQNHLREIQESVRNTIAKEKLRKKEKHLADTKRRLDTKLFATSVVSGLIVAGVFLGLMLGLTLGAGLPIIVAAVLALTASAVISLLVPTITDTLKFGFREEYYDTTRKIDSQFNLEMQEPKPVQPNPLSDLEKKSKDEEDNPPVPQEQVITGSPLSNKQQTQEKKEEQEQEQQHQQQQNTPPNN